MSGAVTFGCRVQVVLPKLKLNMAPRLGHDLHMAMLGNVLIDMTLVCEMQKFPCHKVKLSVITCTFATAID